MSYTRAGTRQGELLKQLPLDYINYLINLPPDALVRIYTYQSAAAYYAAHRLGYFTGSKDVVENLDAYELKDSYAWMVEMMQERIPDFSGDYPVWGWCKRPSAKPKEAPYMGTAGDVRIIALVPRKRILFSDFDTWHCVLNKSGIFLTEKEHDDHCSLWHGRMLDGDYYRTPEYLQEIRRFWPRCFEFNKAKSQEELNWSGSLHYFRVQMCIDRIYLSDVVSTRHFYRKDRS